MTGGGSMVDPVSVAAVTSVLGAVSGGMANEAGKRAWESVGALARRVAGRQVPAPAGVTEREAVARLLLDGARRDPAHARALAAWMRGAPQTGTATTAPHLLPASTRFFTDRREALRQLDREAARRPDGRPRLVLLHGPEGIGTSALAVHWGAREAQRFPDGRLYADLLGDSAGTALDPAAVLQRFLGQLLGVGPEELPPGTGDRVDLFRALLADRKLLVVLDHAHSAAQVRPLLTAAPEVVTVVVARHPLPGLDALRIAVGPLDREDAVRLLTDLAGKQAVAAAKATLPAVLERCGGSPLALRAAAPRLSATPLLGVANDPVRAAAEQAYRELTPELASGYRRLSLRPWPSLGPRTAAAALGTGLPAAAALLEALADRQLLEYAGTAAGAARYRYRPVLRRHGEELAAREDGIAVCSRTVARTVEGLLRFAVRADRTLLPERWHLGPLYAELAAEAGPDSDSFADPGAAMAALEAELGNLLEAVRAADEFGDPSTVCQLTETLWALQLKAGHHTELLPALRAGARAAGAAFPGSRTAGRAHTQLALALIELHQYEEAEQELLAAAEDERQAGHLRGRATAVESLGLLRLRQWRFQEAADLFDEAGTVLDGIGPDSADEGVSDLPRARALLQRHRGRALRGLGRLEEARESLGSALRFFRAPATAEPYNAARTLTDLAETWLDGSPDAAARATALPLVDEAITALAAEQARYHLAHLQRLRERCLSPDS